MQTQDCTVENSPNPSSVYIRLSKHRKNVLYCFYKITSSKNYNAGKDKEIHFTDENVSSYNIKLTMAFLNWPIKTFKILKSGDRRCGVFYNYVTQPCLPTLMQARLSANQSARTIFVIL